MKIKEYKIAKYKACLDEMLVDEEIKEGLEIIFVEKMKEVIEVALW